MTLGLFFCTPHTKHAVCLGACPYRVGLLLQGCKLSSQAPSTSARSSARSARRKARSESRKAEVESRKARSERSQESRGVRRTVEVGVTARLFESSSSMSSMMTPRRPLPPGAARADGLPSPSPALRHRSCGFPWAGSLLHQPSCQHRPFRKLLPLPPRAPREPGAPHSLRRDEISMAAASSISSMRGGLASAVFSPLAPRLRGMQSSASWMVILVVATE